MSMAAGQALMMKLSTAISSISSRTLTIDAIKSKLKSSAMSSSLYALKIDSGEKKDWLVKEAVPDQNPTIISPDSTDTPKSFETKAAAEAWQAQNNLYIYEYDSGVTSSISIKTLMEPNPKSEGNVGKMADELGPDCLAENNRCWSLPTPRAPTPAELKQVIQNKILSYS